MSRISSMSLNFDTDETYTIEDLQKYLRTFANDLQEFKGKVTCKGKVEVKKHDDVKELAGNHYHWSPA